jgi:hypothetical protein
MSFVHEPHAMEYRRVLSRLVCRHCGLVALRNKFSDWSVRMGCNSAEHPDYERQRMMAGKVVS